MTTEARFERQLPAILEDLYLGPSPDYRDEVLAAADAHATAPGLDLPRKVAPHGHHDTDHPGGPAAVAAARHHSSLCSRCSP